MDKLEFTNKVLTNLNNCMDEVGKVNLTKFTDLTNKQYEAITVTPCCTESKDKETLTFKEYKLKHLDHNRIYDGNYEHKLYGWISVDSFVNMYLKDLSL